MDARYVAARLEQAAALLLSTAAMRATGRGMALERLVEAQQRAHAAAGVDLVPLASHVARMNEALSWLDLLPAGSRDRRVIEARMMVSPITRKPIYSWRCIGTLLGVDHKQVQRWHRAALADLAQRIAAHIEAREATELRAAA